MAKYSSISPKNSLWKIQFRPDPINHNTEGMLLNILCNGVVSYRDEAQCCKSFIDNKFSKSVSIKLWPVLGFLNT